MLQADALAEDVDYDAADMIVLSGGYHGTMNLGENTMVKERCCRAASAGKYLTAICAVPSILAGIGLLEDKEATCHPSFEDKINGAILTYSDVAVDGNLITERVLGGSDPVYIEAGRDAYGSGDIESNCKRNLL